MAHHGVANKQNRFCLSALLLLFRELPDPARWYVINQTYLQTAAAAVIYNV